MNRKSRIFSRRHITAGIAALLLPIVIGCASAPKPMTIKHESTPSLGDAALSERKRKEPVDERITAAMEDLQRRKELSDQRTAALLELLKSKNMISDDEAALLTGQTTTGTAGEPGPAAALEAKISVEEIKEEIRSEVTNELLRQVWTINNALKEKDKRLRFGGDIRLRYELVRFDKNNFNEFTRITQGADTQTLQNTWADQVFLKYRVRFGAEAQVDEQTDAVIRLSTGSTSNPVSTNTTMGDYSNKDTVVFDLAYLRWKPWKSLTFYGGRMTNPWFSTDLVWDNDLNFEGLALNVRGPGTETWTPFLTGGAFPLQQSEPTGISDFSRHAKWLYGGQAGVERKNQKGVSAKVGAAYYHFNNVSGVLNDNPGRAGATDWSAPPFTQGNYSNTLFFIDPNNSTKVGLVSEFKEMNLTGTIDIGFWDPVHVVFLGDYVKNYGFDQDKVNALIGDIKPDDPEDPSSIGFQETPKEIEGYQIGVSVGYPTIREQKQWKVYFYAKRLGKDAVLDAFTDSDFHLGGANAKGWIFGTDVGMAKNMWMTLKWLTADEIVGAPLAIDVLQVDVNARF